MVEDIAQDALLKCIDQIDKYDSGKGNLKNWIYRVTQRHCFDVMRQLKKMDTIPLSFDCAGSTQQTSIDKIDKKKIRKALRLLSKRDRELLMYHVYFDYSFSEISAMTGIPKSQLAVYYRRAKQRLLKEYVQVA
jgi:RNA polymerase sigma factor (sigma-70 family)